MNPCLANLVDDEVLPGPEALVAGGGEEPPAAVTAAGEASDPAVPEVAPSPSGRVLLIEDDEGFKDVTRDYLIECGYTVVAVRSGVEGVREVLAGDFALIFCDMNMPTMPGDMFYRAVERTRPQLCKRFVFMTGYRDDARTSEFIKQVGAYVLRKPFAMHELLDAITLGEVRGAFVSVFDSGATSPVLSRSGRPADSYLAVAKQLPRDHEVAVGVAVPAPNVLTAPMPIEPTRARPWGRRLAILGFAAAGMAVIALPCSLIVSRQASAWQRATAASMERRALEAEWKIVSPQNEQAEKARGNFVSLPERAKRIAAERAAVGWTPALRAVSINAGSEIDLRGLSSRGIDGMAGACEILIEGTATGPTPRAIADRFLQALRRDLDLKFPGAVTAEFEKLEDDPVSTSAPSVPQTARFTIKVRVGTKVESAGAKRS